MTIAFIVCMSSAATISRYAKQYDWWFHAHYALAGVGWLGTGLLSSLPLSCSLGLCACGSTAYIRSFVHSFIVCADLSGIRLW